MADFPGMILTAAGRQLQAKAQIGQALTFTRVALGSGATPAQPEVLTAMVDEKKSLSIQSFEVLGDGTSKMRVILTNQGVTEGFFVTEVGVFARDPDTLQEHLYSYSNSGAQSDFLPAEGGATVVEQIFDLITVVGTAQNVTALIDDFITIATKADVDELRPYTIPAAGTVGQMLRKATNAEGGAEWFDPSEGYDLRIASVSEVRTAVEGQSVFNLSQTITSGLAVYVDGLRLRTDEWDALNATQVRLDAALTAGQKVEFVNNEEVGAGAGGGSMVTLDGPSLVFPGSSNTLTITNHDSFSTYAVATDVGTASLSGPTITLDIPGGATAGNLNLSVTRNGATAIFQIAIGAQSVAQPSILLPSDGAVDVGETPNLTTSSFVTYPNGADTHASTDWQVATDLAFTAIIWESAADAANLTGVTVPTATLAESTTYYVRARHNGNAIGTSPWSAVHAFTTEASFFSQDQVIAQWDLPGHAQYPKAAALAYVPTVDKFLFSDSNQELIYLVDALTPASFTSFATPGFRADGLVFDGTDIWACSETGDMFHQYDLAGNLLNSFAAGFSRPYTLAFDGTNFISYSQADYLIRVHAGKTATITTSFGGLGSNLAGLAVHNGNLYSSDRDIDVIRKHVGISSTIEYSFAPPDGDPRGLTFRNGTMFTVGGPQVIGKNILYQHGEA